MTVDEELSALMDRFFRAVSFGTGGTPEYERLPDLFTPAGRLVNAIGDVPDDTTVAGFIDFIPSVTAEPVTGRTNPSRRSRPLA